MLLSNKYIRLFFNFVKQSFLLYLYLISCIVTAQNYDTVDSVALQYPKNISDATTLAKRLDVDFSTDLDKVRALYIYLTNTVTYNLNEYQYGAESYSFNYSSKQELEKKIRARELEIISQTLLTKKAICEGYSITFKEVCDLLAIKCVVISGYTRTSFSTIGKLPLEGKHAWNAVYINSTWNLIDTTWGAGYSRDSDHWVQYFDEHYFFTKPKHLLSTHFPEAEKWQLVLKPLTALEFTNQPIYASLYFNKNLELISPTTGVLDPKNKDILSIKIKNLKPDSEIAYTYKKDYYLSTLIPEFKDSMAILKIPLKQQHHTTLNILIDTEMILQYKIK